MHTNGACKIVNIIADVGGDGKRIGWKSWGEGEKMMVGGIGGEEGVI